MTFHSPNNDLGGASRGDDSLRQTAATYKSGAKPFIGAGLKGF